jgi:hypothetical protein
LWPVFGRYGLRGLLLDVRGRLDVEGLLARGAEGRDALGRLDVEGLLARGAEGRDALGRDTLGRDVVRGADRAELRDGAEGRLTEVLRVG